MEGSKVEFLFLSREEIIEAGVLDVLKLWDRPHEALSEGATNMNEV